MIKCDWNIFFTSAFFLLACSGARSQKWKIALVQESLTGHKHLFPFLLTVEVLAARSLSGCSHCRSRRQGGSISLFISNTPTKPHKQKKHTQTCWTHIRLHDLMKQRSYSMFTFTLAGIYPFTLWLIFLDMTSLKWVSWREHHVVNPGCVCVPVCEWPG